MNGWCLAPLLALRVRAEERARGELGIALALAQQAGELVLARRLAWCAGVVETGGSVVGAELVVAALFLDRLGRELRDALARAREARAAANTAQRQHAMAHRELEGLQRERARWLEARRRARAAAAERELDDLPGRQRWLSRPPTGELVSSSYFAFPRRLEPLREEPGADRARRADALEPGQTRLSPIEERNTTQL